MSGSFLMTVSFMIIYLQQPCCCEQPLHEPHELHPPRLWLRTARTTAKIIAAAMMPPMIMSAIKSLPFNF